jgi:uncharacterized protein YecT (DUF1311 family)
MRILITFIFLFNCYSLFPQTQFEINQEAKESYEKSDKELNDAYKQLIASNKGDTAFIHSLKISQRLWIKFRDAELKLRFPDREPGYYGSMLPMCESNYLKKLTDERVATLKRFLDKSIMDDGCN